MRPSLLSRQSGHMEDLSEAARLFRSVKAVVFDLDDTLVESTVDYGKFKALTIDRLVQNGERREDYSPQETIVAIVKRYEDRLRSRGLLEEDIRRRLAEIDRIMDEVEMERVEESVAYPGARELLQLLRANGKKIGILTRGCELYTRTALAKAGLADQVDAVESRNSETRPKPDRQAYEKLADALGLKSSETLLVGDHPIDGQCARNAGVPFVAVRTGEVPDERLREAGAVAVFDSVRELADFLAGVFSRKR